MDIPLQILQWSVALLFASLVAFVVGALALVALDHLCKRWRS